MPGARLGTAGCCGKEGMLQHQHGETGDSRVSHGSSSHPGALAAASFSAHPGTGGKRALRRSLRTTRHIQGLGVGAALAERLPQAEGTAGDVPKHP